MHAPRHRPAGARRLLVLVGALAGLSRPAEAQLPVPDDARPTQRAAAQALARLDEAARRGDSPRAALVAISRDIDGRLWAGVFIDATPGVENALRARGIRVGGRAGRYVTARLPLDELADVAAIPGVRGIGIAPRAAPLHDSSMVDIGVSQLRARSFSDLFQGKDGRGAIVGVVDTGIDFKHLDFVEDDVGRSRILYLWDQRDKTGLPPGTVNGVAFTYGRECSRQELGPQGTCPSIDNVGAEDGHGTHVTGTAAGDGSAGGVLAGGSRFQFTGVAPGAEIVVVRTTFDFNDIVDGVNYIFQRAALLGRPAVVNLSLGSQFGPHDGTEIPTLALDALTGPGRVVVVAAGNEGNNRNGGPAGVNPSIHAEGTVLVGDSVVVEFTVPGYVPNSGSASNLLLVQGFYDKRDSFDLSIARPLPAPRVHLPASDSALTANDPAGTIIAYNGSLANEARLFGSNFETASSYPTSPTRLSDIYIGQWLPSGTAPAPGVWRLVMRRAGGLGPGTVDLWLSYSTLPNPVQFTLGQTNRRLVGSPGDGRKMITVGGYSTRVSWLAVDGHRYRFTQPDSVGTGDLLLFSSPGPTRDGRLKPEIAAPGRVFSALSSAVTGAIPIPLIAPDSVHDLLEGTSMATPHVTGTVALLLAERPSLSPSEIVSVLQRGARTDGYTARSYAFGDPPGTPNNSWGGGKLNVPGALALVAPTVGRVIAAINPHDTVTRRSAPGALVPLQTVRLQAADAESLTITRVAATVSGIDRRGLRLGAAIDLNHNGVVDPGEPVAVAADSVVVLGPRLLAVSIPPGALTVPAGGTADMLVVAQLSGATPNAATFTAALAPDSSFAVGLRSGATFSFAGTQVLVTAQRTTLLASGEKYNLSQNPVRCTAEPAGGGGCAKLRINLAEQANAIDVYDFSGRLVRRLRPLPTDRRVEWDLTSGSGEALANGTYILRLDLVSGTFRQKLFVLR